MRVLAVDDDEPTLEILSILLARLGFSKMVEALSAKEAMESIESSRSPYECILLDMQMSGVDGIELCTRLRQLPDYAHCPIIMVSAMTDPKYMELAYKAGASDYITKPFNVDDLTLRLDRAMMRLQSN